MTPQERIEFIIEHCSGGSIVRFSDDTGIDRSTSCKIRSGKLGASEKEGLGRFAERIYRAYPQLNAAWLLTGEGEPFTTPESPIIDAILRRLKKVEDALQHAVDGAPCK